jgi:hypothetical protein
MAESFLIVGAFFRPPAKAILASLAGQTPLWLVPEPDNNYDPHAVKVTVRTEDVGDSSIAALGEALPNFGHDLDSFFAEPEWHLGYIPRNSAGPEIFQAPDPMPGWLTFDLSGRPTITLL